MDIVLTSADFFKFLLFLALAYLPACADNLWVKYKQV